MKSISFAFPALAILLTASSCVSKSSETTNESVKQVPITGLTVMDTTIYKEYIADIQATKNVEIRSRLTGFLERIYVDEGAAVKTGQVLFKLNDTEYKADCARAEAALNIAIAEAKKVELEKERTKRLVEKNIVSQTEEELIAVQHKAALSKVEEARAVLHQARTQLSQTLIRAPFNGRLDRILLKEGSLLTEGALLTNISDLNNLNVYFDISESEYLDMANDSSINTNTMQKEVKLMLANGQEYPHKGIAHIVESEFERNTGSISLRAKFPNSEAILKHGASGKIGVPISTGETMFIHQKSVLEIQDKTYAFLYNTDGRIKMHPFQAGPRVGHYYIVEDGLDVNSKIVYEGIQSLRDGMKVRAITKR